MWIWGAFMPHPPILVPEVGKGRETEAESTLEGYSYLTQKISRAMPDFLLLLSPHQPYAPGKLFLNASAHYKGDFAHFGAPSVAFDIGGTPEEYALRSEKIASLEKFLSKKNIPAETGAVDGESLDQGSIVPLYYLQKEWGALPLVIAASPIGLSYADALRFGKALRAFNDDAKWALLASGDLSHRLTPDAPAGFSPVGKKFDAAVVEAFSTGNPSPVATLSPDAIDSAGECGLRSALALIGLAAAPIDVISYEGPFGVGYCNALWVPDGHAARNQSHPYPALAREAVRARLTGEPVDTSIVDSSGKSLWDLRRACFVSIHSRDGSLRGCIGTLEPVHESISEEIIANAISAALRDPRFLPVTIDELDDLEFSVDILESPEPAAKEDLDPKTWGVIVSRDYRRGVLLPDLEGVDTVEAQLGIALQKAGIRRDEDYRIMRFKVERYPE